MAKLTFGDVKGKECTFYIVSIGGAIRKHTSKHICDDVVDLNASTKHINKNGGIDIGWGYAVFLNAEDAAEMAIKIVTRKYNNSIEKIKKVTNT